MPDDKYVTEETPILGTDTSWVREIPHYGAIPDIGEKVPDVSIPTVKEKFIDVAIPKRYQAGKPTHPGYFAAYGRGGLFIVSARSQGDARQKLDKIASNEYDLTSLAPAWSPGLDWAMTEVKEGRAEKVGKNVWFLKE